MKRELIEKLRDGLRSVKGLHCKSGLTYALAYFAEVARLGIGVSRRDVTRSTRELSPVIHSWSTFHRYLGICKEFVLFAKAKGVNKLHKLDYGTVEQFLLMKIAKGRRANTLEANMCALMKFFHVCGRDDLRDRLADDYSRMKGLSKPGGNIHAFDDPSRLIKQIERRDELSAVAARLQLLTGARIHEVRPMEIAGQTIKIKGKGGKVRVLDFSWRPEELAEVETLRLRLEELSASVDWQEFCQRHRGTYQKTVKAACRALGDEYAGAHGLRGNHSQELEKKLEERGLPEDEIELAITRELGHERRSMARHYLRV